LVFEQIAQQAAGEVIFGIDFPMWPSSPPRHVEDGFLLQSIIELTHDPTSSAITEALGMRPTRPRASRLPRPAALRLPRPAAGRLPARNPRPGTRFRAALGARQRAAGPLGRRRRRCREWTKKSGAPASIPAELSWLRTRATPSLFPRKAPLLLLLQPVPAKAPSSGPGGRRASMHSTTSEHLFRRLHAFCRCHSSCITAMRGDPELRSSVV
jgi:hypothetical protein